jgi:hypothetical protein
MDLLDSMNQAALIMPLSLEEAMGLSLNFPDTQAVQ